MRDIIKELKEIEDGLRETTTPNLHITNARLARTIELFVYALEELTSDNKSLT